MLFSVCFKLMPKHSLNQTIKPLVIFGLFITSIIKLHAYTPSTPTAELPCNFVSQKTLPENVVFPPYPYPCSFIDGKAPVISFEGISTIDKDNLDDFFDNPELFSDSNPYKIKYGLVNLKGELVAPPIYDFIMAKPIQLNDKHQVLYEARIKGKAGLINSKGETLIPFDYSSLEFYGIAYSVQVTKALIPTNSNAKFPNEFQLVSIDELNKYIQTNKVQSDKTSTLDYRILTGLFDVQGKQLTSVSYDEIYADINNGFIKDAEVVFTARKNGKWGFVGEDDKLLYPFILDYDKVKISSLSNELLLVRKDNKYGAVNRLNEIVIPLEYDSLSRLSYDQLEDELIEAEKNGKVGVINYQNQVVIPFEYGMLSPREDGLIVVENYVEPTNFAYDYSNPPKTSLYKLGLIDINNETIYPIELEKFGEKIKGTNLRFVKKEGKYGLATIEDKKYRQVIPFIYDELTTSSISFDSSLNRQHPDYEKFSKDRYLRAKKGDKQGILNLQGEIVIPFDFAKIRNFSTLNFPLVAVAKATDNPYRFKWQIYNILTQKTINDEFDDFIDNSYQLSPYSGLIGVYKDKNYGYLNANGQVAIDFDFQSAHPFLHDLAIVKKDDNWLLIDSTGKTVQQLGNYDYVSDFKGYYYSKDEVLNSGVMVAQKSGKKGLINSKGDVVIPIKYRDVDILRGVDNDGLFEAIDEKENTYIYNTKGELLTIEEINKNIVEFQRSLEF